LKWFLIQDRLAVAVVDPRASPLPAGGTGPAVGVERLDELAVAGVLVQVVDQGEIPGGVLRVRRDLSPSKRTRSESAVKTRARISPHEPRGGIPDVDAWAQDQRPVRSGRAILEPVGIHACSATELD
jgi:hypothetical protein